MDIKQYAIYYADLSPVVGSEQGGLRPVVIVSNDMGNKHSPVVIAAPATSRVGKKRLPTQIIITSRGGLSTDSMVMCEQIRTIDKSRLSSYIGKLTDIEKYAIRKALKISLGVE